MRPMNTPGTNRTSATSSAASANRPEASRLPASLFGSGSSVATKALGLKKALTNRAHQVGIKLGLVNHQNATVRKIIDSIGIKQ